MNDDKVKEVLLYLNQYAKEQYNQGKRKTRELFPSFDDIAKNCNITIDKTKLIIDFLEKRGDIIRYTSQRYLKWIWEKLNQQNNEETNQVKEEEITPIKKKKTFNINIIIFFLLFEMFVVGIFTIYISIDFTYMWFVAMLSPFQSMILSTAFVLSGINFFILYTFLQNKKGKKQVKFLIISLIIISFSITTGLFGQLNKAIEKKIISDKSQLKDKNDSSLYNYLTKESDSIQKDIDSVRKEKNDLQIILKKLINKSNYSYDNTNDRNLYNSLDKKIVYKNVYIESLKLKKEDNEKEIKVLLKKENTKINITQNIDFFDWLASIFTTIKADIWRFLLYLLLAIFVDIVPPINFSIVLNYIRKLNEKS
jgi:hypothetical protein